MQGDAGLGLVEIRGNWPGHGLQSLARADLGAGRAPTVLIMAAPTQDVQPSGMTGTGVAGNAGWLDRWLRSRANLPPFASLLSTWRSRFCHFRALRPGTQRSQELASSNRLDPSGGNLAAVLLYLATDRPALFAQLRLLMGEIVPDIGRLEVRTAAANYEWYSTVPTAT